MLMALASIPTHKEPLGATNKFTLVVVTVHFVSTAADAEPTTDGRRDGDPLAGRVAPAAARG
jgi:hypothetical protein